MVYSPYDACHKCLLCNCGHYANSNPCNPILFSIEFKPFQAVQLNSRIFKQLWYEFKKRFQFINYTIEQDYGSLLYYINLSFDTPLIKLLTTDIAASHFWLLHTTSLLPLHHRCCHHICMSVLQWFSKYWAIQHCFTWVDKKLLPPLTTMLLPLPWTYYVVCLLLLLPSIIVCKVFLSDKNHTGIDDRCVSSWFCSHPVGSYPRDQERTTDPYQDRPSSNLTISPWHHSPSSSTYLTNDGSHLQWNQATSPLKSHIIIKSYSRGLQWDFCWNPQETDQDLGFKISFEPKLVRH